MNLAVRWQRWEVWLEADLAEVSCWAGRAGPDAAPHCARSSARRAPAGVPFRETHHISGAAVKLAEDRGCELSELSVADLQSIHPLFADDVVEVGAGRRRGRGCCGAAAWARRKQLAGPSRAAAAGAGGARATLPPNRMNRARVLPAGPQVWDFNRSAEMRDTEGGASKRSVLEQAAKLRAYLAESA